MVCVGFVVPGSMIETEETARPVYITGNAVSVTEPPRHGNPLASFAVVAVATPSAFTIGENEVESMTTSAFARTS